ncbi:MAG: hypothetical protein MR522_02855 [Trueperella sp.]|uniref:hypothetical protein n=1 Tax=Trueperella sp. TaxID=2699835 RepID=UPI0025D57CCA|nr:hypothetical protein [Trueperella sp.]MCI7305195.1 hypothetical protein [Trueperella sp.]MDY5402767.1 hypothetical protein [Trueperella sp.]
MSETVAWRYPHAAGSAAACVHRGTMRRFTARLGRGAAAASCGCGVVRPEA